MLEKSSAVATGTRDRRQERLKKRYFFGVFKNSQLLFWLLCRWLFGLVLAVRNEIPVAQVITCFLRYG
jgi:hypothetical protein